MNVFREHGFYEERGVPEVKLRIPEILTAEEQEALLEQFNTRYASGERNLVAVLLMLNAGLRVAECTGLTWRDLDLQTGKIKVRGKGSRDRVLWVNGETLEALKRWRERQAREAKQRGGIEAPEFVVSTLKGGPLTTRQIQDMVVRYRKKAGIEKQATPHTLRHTFATELLRETGNIRLVQKALGHSSLTTTQVYLHLIDEELEEALKNFRRGKVKTK